MTMACPACVAVPMQQDMAAGPSVQFSLPQIHCAACIGKIERGLTTLNGVTNVRVNLSLKRVTVSGQMESAQVESALRGLGFEAYPLDLEELNKAHDSVGRALLLRMAIAGFAMMNVMLLSVAVWSGATDATRDMFHLISAMIALPVVAYSGQPFFQNAWSALQVGRLNMDVPISLAITLAAGMSLFETLNGGAHAYFDAALSLTFFLLVGRYMDHRTRSAARSAAKELTALEVQTAQRIENGMATRVPLAQLAIGDIISVATGARVPVDGILETYTALMDRSVLTGETATVPLSQGAMLQAGEINVAGTVQIRATAVGDDTSLRRMASLVETAENSRNKYTALADRAAQIYAPAVHVLALCSFAGWIIVGGDIRHATNVAIAVLIITCPCALGLAVPAVSTAAISRLFSMGYLVKHATALERLAEVTRIVFDKTGTLSVPSLIVPNQMSAEDKAIAKALAQSSDHPLSRALEMALGDIVPAKLEAIQETAGQGISAKFHNRQVHLGRGAWLSATFHDLGLKVGAQPAQAFQATEVPRSGVRKALAELKLPCEIVTGDAAIPAELFAADIGLEVTANVRPDAKLKYLEQLKANNDLVMMVGDGLNDTAALAAAHASVAPATALDASRSASDIVILKDSFEDLPLLLRIARLSRRLSKQNFAIAALYNSIAIPIALAGLATPLAAALAMSASSITVLLNSQRIRFAK